MSEIFIDIEFTGLWHTHALRSSERVVNTTTDEQFITHLAKQGVHQASVLGRSYPDCVWPGGYPLFYVVDDSGVLCHECASAPFKNDPESWRRTVDKDDAQFYITAADVNWEDQHMNCEHCGHVIPAAYANDEGELPTQPAGLAD
jgi:hypothetical protein